MDNQRRIDLAFKLLDNVQNLIKCADAKINVLLIISGVTTTFILSNFQDLFDLCLLSKIVLIMFFILFFVFVYFSIQTIAPQTDKYTGNSVSKIIYFKHVAKRVEVKDFINDFDKLDDVSFLNDLLYQIFENSKIADKKFNNYNNSLVAIKAQILIFFILLGLKFYM